MSNAAWLEALYSTAPGYLSVVSDRDWTGWRFPTSRLDRAVRCLDQHGARSNVYVGVGTLNAPVPNGRGGANDVLSIPGLWSDFDIAGPHHKPSASGLPHPPDEPAVRRLLDDLGLPPSALIHSGHGLYGWWLFPAPWELDEVDEHAAARVLAARFGATLVELGRRRGWHVDDVGDLARVLRVPGTVNRKGEPIPVELRELSPHRYLPSDLEDVLVAPSPPPRREHRAASPLLETPIDVFNRAMPWSRILEPAGWRYTRSVGNVDHWARSGKPGKVTSATTGFGDGADLLYVWSDDPDVLPLPTKKWLNKFQAFAILRHGGDNRAAFHALVDAGRRAA